MPNDDGDAVSDSTGSAASRSGEVDFAQVAVDAKLYHACRQQDMADEAFVPLAEHMMTQAFGMLCSGIHTKQLGMWIQQRNKKIRLSIPRDICRAEIEDLAAETVSRAIGRFKQQMTDDDGWHEDSGQTLETYFRMLCLNEFPNVIRKWRKDRTREVPGLPDDLARTDPPATVNTEPGSRDGSAIEPHLTTRQRRAFRLLSGGFSFPQIGESMGISVRAVKTLLGRVRAVLERKRKDS